MATPPPPLPDVGTPGNDSIPSTAAIVGGVVGGLSILTLGLAAALVVAVARIYGWRPFKRRFWAWSSGAGRFSSSNSFGKKGDVEAALELARGDVQVPSIVTTRLAGGSESEAGEQYHTGDQQYQSSNSAMTRRSSTEARTGSPLRNDVSWRDCVIEADKIQILRRRDGRPWILGGGAFGQVYKALYDGVQVVAAKVITGLADERVLESFVREAAILRDMRDRNIIQFVGVCMGREEEGQPDEAMMIQEFAEAGDLFKALKWRDQAGRRVYGWYARGKKATIDIARGLHYLHSHKIVHLDLKSSNVLLARDGTCKLADVGLARSLQSKAWLTSAGTMGTFAWSAPEVLTGQHVSTAADIYSLGIVLWEIVTGEIPNRGTMRNPRVTEECPQDIVDLIDRCTSVDPRARPTAKEIVQMLEGLPLASPRSEDNSKPLRTASLGPWRKQLPQQVSKYMPESHNSPLNSDDLPKPSPFAPVGRAAAPSAAAAAGRAAATAAMAGPPSRPSPFAAASSNGSFGTAASGPGSGPFGSTAQAASAAAQQQQQQQAVEQQQQQQASGQEAAAPATQTPAAAAPGPAVYVTRRGSRRSSELEGLKEEQEVEEEEEEEEGELGLADTRELEEAQRRTEEGGEVAPPPMPTLRLEDLPPLSSGERLFG